MLSEPGRCVICACTDERPCLGAAVFTSRFEAEHVHRLVPDRNILEDGTTCAWVDEDDTICSGHTEDEIAMALAYGGEDLPRVVTL